MDGRQRRQTQGDLAAEDHDVGCRSGRAARRLRCRGRESGRTQPFGVRPVRDSDRVRLSLNSVVTVVSAVTIVSAVHEW
ncbi:hypothetical protein [Streptomyces sp. NBC_00576]|uniref:hypothetical protein n=1 Tax=Streptomyces sp. NBC_00576 TaxID=2903665 RepID=UPI002E801302|nr:hypothetical protein [Streptomyces sp. NBC_00576]WUB73194.1 hypothetical protein OG734_25660 [Streptomyces sp. NBC_00576]